MHDTEQRALEAIERLNYDFRQFTLHHFLHHLMRVQQRKIVLQPLDFEEIHAAWMAVGQLDYIFYDANTHEVHQIHNILHECGHIALGHSGRDIRSLVSPALLRAARALTAEPVRGRLRMPHPSHDPQEREAEAFVRLLRREILTADRLEHLTGRASGIDGLARFARHLGYRD
jgi:hypothetical protein